MVGRIPYRWKDDSAKERIRQDNLNASPRLAHFHAANSLLPPPLSFYSLSLTSSSLRGRRILRTLNPKRDEKR